MATPASARYGCKLCDDDDLPPPGYLDRLKKTHPRTEKYSLQYHVETHHPTVTDWMSLRVNLNDNQGRAKGTGKGKGKSRKESSSEEDDNDDDDYQNFKPRSNPVRLASKRKHVTSSSSEESEYDKNLPPRPKRLIVVTSSDEEESIDTNRNEAVAHPNPITSVVQEALYTRVPEVDLREQNIQLAAANQEFSRTNSGLRQQLGGHLNFVCRSVWGDMVQNQVPLSPQAVFNYLHCGSGDGQFAEQNMGRVFAVLSNWQTQASEQQTAAQATTLVDANSSGGTTVARITEISTTSNTQDPSTHVSPTYSPLSESASYIEADFDMEIE